MSPAGRSAEGGSDGVLVIGGGVAGLTCARTLEARGVRAVVVDKGRSPGGRCSTRRRGSAHFDHGAQYFTVRDPAFALHVESWRREGAVALWRGRIGALEQGEVSPGSGTTRRYVGVPGMSALGGRLADGLEVHPGRRVERLLAHRDGWEAEVAGGDRFAAGTAVVAVPAPQALPLLAPVPVLADRVSGVEMTPCWAVLAAFGRRLPCELDGAFVSGSPLSWIGRNSSKPGRPNAEAWVLHAGADWSRRHLDREPEAVIAALLTALARAIGRPLPDPVAAEAHRWGFAQASRPLGEICLFDREQRIGVCGDWCPGERIEGAFLSGRALAERILAAR